MRISDWSSDVCSSDLKQHQVGAREPLSATFDHLVSGNPVVAADDYAQWNVRLGQGAQPARPVCAAFCAEAIQRTDSKLAALLTDQRPVVMQFDHPGSRLRPEQ